MRLLERKSLSTFINGLEIILQRTMAAIHVSLIFGITVLFSIILLELVQFFPVNFIGLALLVYTGGILLGIVAISFSRALLWLQSFIWAFWRLYTAPFYYEDNGNIVEEEFEFPPTHKRRVDRHIISSDINQRAKKNSIMGLILMFLIFSLFLLTGIFITAVTDTDIVVFLERIIGETMVSALVLIFNIVTEIVSEMGAISVIISRFRDFLQDDVIIGILLIGTILSSTFTRNYLHYYELKFQENTIRMNLKSMLLLVIIVVMSTVLSI